MTDQQKVKAIMKELGIKSLKDLAEILGYTYDSTRSIFGPKGKLPRWVNLLIYVWENKALIEKLKGLKRYKDWDFQLDYVPGEYVKWEDIENIINRE